MKWRARDGEASGTRDEVADELRNAAAGWAQRGHDHLSDEAEEALEAIRNGADEARVGRTVFRVDGSGDSGSAQR
jgi:hypothetical protein